MSQTFLVVGCGISGITAAERIASLGKRVLILEKRDHIGGNCYDYIDPKTGILVNKYGAHLFHTNNKQVWDYINRFSKWIRWEHQVLSYVEGQFIPIPVNITTVNRLCGQNLQNSEEMDRWLSKNQVKYDKIENSEQMAKSRVGETLFSKMFEPYTQKQWNKPAKELAPSVLARIPVRNDFNVRYFSDKYQALPEKGYTELFKNMLDHPLIDVRLGVDFLEIKRNYDLSKYTIIYTGPVDRYFDTCYGNLEYRSIDFNLKRYKMNFFQPNSVVNYPELKYPFTRRVEYKHFLNQKSPYTVVVSESTIDHGEPYYPVPTKRNLELHEKYRKLMKKEKNVFFVGRGTYKYYNMDQAVESALDLFTTSFSTYPMHSANIL
jgi:UDP-galactopyranose mutase